MAVSAATSAPASGSNPVDQNPVFHLPKSVSSEWTDYFSAVASTHIPMRKRKDVSSQATNVADSTSSSVSEHSKRGGSHATVNLGQTLWNVAGNYDVGGATRYQKMVAIFNANPHAFVDNDMNRLKAGARLSLPSSEMVRAVDAAEALRLCSDQINAHEQKRHGTASEVLSSNKGAWTGLKPGDTVLVTFGQTLSEIANKYQVTDTTLSQRTVAIFSSNPHAFTQNNMNRMKTGVRLALPDAEKVRSVTADTAQLIVNEQWQAYKASRARAPDLLSN